MIDDAIRRLKRHPFTILGLVTYGLFLAQALLRLPYDDGGVGTFLFLGSYVLGFPFHGVVSVFHGLLESQWLALLSGFVGLIPYGVADAVLRRARER